jgi:aryl-alcohol dehydrogenase-like predicted oxidoreductase
MTPAATATPEGTAAYAARHPRAAPGHFRRTAAGGLTVSSIGLGTYLGKADQRADAGYAAAVERAVSLGCNVLDTAVNYREQRSERVLGATLARLQQSGALRREEVVVATKGGFLPADSGRPGGAGAYVEQELLRPGVITGDDIVAGCHCMTPAYLRHQLGASLANLGLQGVDVYYVHNPETQLEEVSRPRFEARIRDAFAALEAEAAEGRVGVYGVATWNGLRTDRHSGEHLSLRALLDAARDAGGDGHHFRALQLPLNLAMPQAVAERTQEAGDGRVVSLLDLAAEHGMTVMASASLLQGRLARGLPDAMREALAATGLHTDAQRALQFTRSAPGLATALVGMSDAAHAEENCAVAAVAPLDAERFRSLFVAG